jgi:hypothetical protein
VSTGSIPPEGGPPASAADWLGAVVDAERRGELLGAFDLAERGLDEHPGDVPLAHRAVLALARAGSTEQAARQFEQYGLAGVDGEDVRALAARIAKDRALTTTGHERRGNAVRSATLYEAIFADTGGYYPGINAATLRLVGGEVEEARRLARHVLDVLRTSGDEGYYAAASEAEAHLLLDDVPAAATALERAAQLHGGDYGAVATTRRQLRLVCDERGLDAGVLARLAGPRVIHYCGHRVGALGAFPREREQDVAAAVAEELERRQPAYAYGSLANGADIICAEARPGSSASNSASRRQQRCATRPTTRFSATTCSTATPPSSRWGSRFCALGSSTRTSSRSRSGTANPPAARPGPRSTSQRGREVATRQP